MASERNQKCLCVNHLLIRVTVLTCTSFTFDPGALEFFLCLPDHRQKAAAGKLKAIYSKGFLQVRKLRKKVTGDKSTEK